MRRSSVAAALVLASVLALPTFAVNYSAPAPTPPGNPSATAVNRVLVIPFLTLNISSDKQWIGKAVQETLIADLGQTDSGGGVYSPIAFNGQVIVEDNATAARLAREASTLYAVRGSAQAVNGDIRLTAQLIDAKSGDTLATGIVTGKAEDLLKLEDELASQLRVATAAPPLGYSTGTGYVPRSKNPPPAPATLPLTTMNQPLNANNYPASNDYQEYGAPAYTYSPVYSPSYLDYGTYQYVPSYTYASPYYPVYPVSIFAGFGDFHHHNGFHDGFHSGFHGGFHGGSGFHSGFSFHSGSFAFHGGSSHGGSSHGGSGHGHH